VKNIAARRSTTSHSVFQPSRALVSSTTNTSSNPDALDFSNGEKAFAPKSTGELFRGWCVLYFCSFGALVRRSSQMYDLSQRVLGGSLTHALIEKTLFRHFCAGVDEQDIIKPIMRLRAVGVGGILDYAAEAKEEDTEDITEGTIPLKSSARSRVHLYEGEAKCDENTKIFLHAVRAVRNVSDNGFAAVKLSGLGEPALLERMSEALIEMERFFSVLLESSTRLSYESFLSKWQTHFHIESVDKIRAVFDKLDLDRDGWIDLVDWTSNISLVDASELLLTCKIHGQLYKSALTRSELEKLRNLLNRCDQICGLAADLNVRVMLDAEWTAIQPAIDHIVLQMQKKYNRSHAIVFGTYQAYLRGSAARVDQDVERSVREQWKFGAKIVRGAYMVSERERSARLNLPCPIWETYEETEENYHRIIEKLISNPATEIMVASHNESTMNFVIRAMAKFDKPKSAVSFGQLMGMADNLTFTLGANNFQAFKYIPYGPVDEVMPYLIRRTQENSTLLGTPAVVKERKMLFAEVKRRLMHFKKSS
jgi:proline dehydrogenase